LHLPRKESIMPITQSLPRARVEGLITTETASDLLIYDTERNELHTLNAMAAAVWRAADGSRSVTGIATETGLEKSVVQQCLETLAASHLVANLNVGPAKSGRRRFLKKAGAAAAIPVIISVTAPMAAGAVSCPVGAIPKQACDGTNIGVACCKSAGCNDCGTCQQAGEGKGFGCE
jgi:hypothetical protein